MNMSILTFTLPEEKAEQLLLSARELGVPIEELLQKITDDFLVQKEEFQSASAYVLQKNAELYRRLAK
jgi:antitoxin FitA